MDRLKATSRGFKAAVVGCLLLFAAVCYGAVAHVMITNFTAGELSPLLDARVDIGKYENGCRVLENFMVFPHGPAAKRPGLRYVGETKDSGKAHLIPFEFSKAANQAYVLEFGDHYMRVHTNRATVVVDGDENVANGTFAANTTGWSSTNSASVAWNAFAGGCCYLTENGAAQPGMRQIITGITPFGDYELSFRERRVPGINYWTVVEDIANGTFGAEKVANPGFELGDVNWSDYNSPSTSGSTTEEVRTGAKSWCVVRDGDASFQGMSSDVYATTTGSIYRLSYWVKPIAITGSTAYATGVQCRTRVRLGDNSGFHSITGNVDIQPNEWNYVEHYFQETNGGANAYVGLASVNSAVTQYFFDDVTLKEMTAGVTLHYSGLQASSVYWNSHVTEFPASSGDALLLSVYTDAAAGSGSLLKIDDLSVVRTDTPYEIGTPYAAEDVADLKCCQSGDSIYFAHPLYKPRNLGRYDHDDWRLGTFEPAYDKFESTVSGFPSCVAIYQDRLVWAGSTPFPLTMFFSKTGEFENYHTGAADNEGMIFTLNLDQVNAIQWLSSGQVLAVGTMGGECRIGSPDDTDPLTPTNVFARRETTYGSYKAQPVRAGHSILFVQRAQRRIREMAYHWETGGYTAPDLTLLAEHITESGVSMIAYQQEPSSVLWALRADGTLIGLTYLRDQDVMAWHRHVTEGAFESLCAVANAETQQDDLYTIVAREVAGVTRRYIEVLESDFRGVDLEDAFFVDSGLSYDGPPVNHITGAGHLSGETVAILADGAVQAPQVVDGEGGVTLFAAASQVQLGLPYTATLQSMRLEAPTDDNGISQGRIKRISEIYLRLYEATDFSVGPTETKLTDVAISCVTPFSGDVKWDYPAGYETDAHITVVHDDPLPFTLQGIVAKIRAGE